MFYCHEFAGFIVFSLKTVLVKCVFASGSIKLDLLRNKYKQDYCLMPYAQSGWKQFCQVTVAVSYLK